MSLRMTGTSDEWIKVSKDGRDSRMSTASGERRSMSRPGDEGRRKYSRDRCDNRDLRDESDESLAETEVYVSDENRWRKASEVFPDHPGDANGRRSRALSEQRESGDIRQSLSRKSGFGDGDVNRPSVAKGNSYADQGDRHSVSYRKSYASRDDEGDVNRSSVTNRNSYADQGDRQSVSYRKSYASRDDEGDIPRSLSRKSGFGDGDVNRPSVASRKSYADQGDMRQSLSRKSGLGDGDVNRPSVASRKSYADQGDRQSVSYRKSYASRDDEGDTRQSLSRKSGFGDSDVTRPSVANRNSYADQGDRQSISYRKSYASQDDEGDACRSAASRKSYADDSGDRLERRSTRKSTFEDAGDARRASRKSYADEDGDLRRSVMRKSEVDLGRDEEGGDANGRRSRALSERRESGDARQSVASRKSYADDSGDRFERRSTRKSSFEDAGDARQASDLRRSVMRKSEVDLGRDEEGGHRFERRSTRKSTFEDAGDANGRRSRALNERRESGAEQRMLSQPPEDSESDILMQDGFRRKSEVRGPKARQMLTLELDADSPSEMKSIVWKFTERGACVKVLNKDCPEASPEMLRAGDLLTFINDECVLDQAKAFIQKTWKEQQLEDRFVTLRFKPVDYEADCQV